MAAHINFFHATTWWIWAMCAAISISIQSNLLIVLLTIAFSVWTAKNLVTDLRNWKTFLVMVRIAFFILVSRIILQILLGVPVGSNVLIRLPSVQLPDWITGLRIGGVVTMESVTASLNDSIRLAGLIVVIATAVSLTTTSRVIQQLPIAFHEMGMVIIIAFTFLPHLFEDVQRIKQASRWRGQEFGRIKTISHNLISVSESALERSVRLAAALSVRGYASATANQNWRKPIYAGLTIFTFSLVKLLVSTPNFLDFTGFAISGLLIMFGIQMAGKVATRTRFRTETWNFVDFIVIAFSILLLIGSLASSQATESITALAICIFAYYVLNFRKTALATA